MSEQHLTIRFEAEPSDDDMETIGRGLSAYNESRGGPDDFERLCLSLRDADGTLLGGLIGATYWGWFYMDILLVNEGCRTQGYGKKLLAQAERIAHARGARHAFLDTFSFQAEPFYARRGYRVFGALDGSPPGHRRVWMTKALAPGIAE